MILNLNLFLGGIIFFYFSMYGIKSEFIIYILIILQDFSYR